MLNRYFCMSEPNRSGKLSHLPNRTDINWCGIPNCAILKCSCKAHHAQIRTTRENAYRGENTHHAPMRTTRENAPRARMHHARECAPRVRMRTTRENAHHARECAPRARMRTMGENAHHAPMRTTRKWVPWGRMRNTTRECLPRAKYPSVEQFM